MQTQAIAHTLVWHIQDLASASSEDLLQVCADAQRQGLTHVTVMSPGMNPKTFSADLPQQLMDSDWNLEE